MYVIERELERVGNSYRLRGGGEGFSIYFSERLGVALFLRIFCSCGSVV